MDTLTEFFAYRPLQVMTWLAVFVLTAFVLPLAQRAWHAELEHPTSEATVLRATYRAIALNGPSFLAHELAHAVFAILLGGNATLRLKPHLRTAEDGTEQVLLCYTRFTDMGRGVRGLLVALAPTLICWPAALALLAHGMWSAADPLVNYLLEPAIVGSLVAAGVPGNGDWQDARASMGPALRNVALTALVAWLAVLGWNHVMESVRHRDVRVNAASVTVKAPKATAAEAKSVRTAPGKPQSRQ